MTALDFGSLNDVLAKSDPRKNLMDWLESEDDYRRQHPDVANAATKLERLGEVNLLRSAGPISDAYILSTHPVSIITGPQGSGKTIASIKKNLVEAQRIRPGSGGVRRYVPGIYRQTYDNLWKATIPSWWQILPRADFPQWTGASPRAALHVVPFEDRWGRIEITAHFRAFGEVASPEDLKGLQYTDVYLNEIDTMPEDLLTWLIGRVGRDPVPEIMGRQGRVFGDMNAPDVLNWTYKRIYEGIPNCVPGSVTAAGGFAHFRQPGGLDQGAENLQSYATLQDPSGRGYYLQQAALNADKPWWVKRMIHAIPGLSRATDLVYDKFDERTMIAPAAIKPEPMLPVIVGIDGGLTPAAVYLQEMPDGQLRILAEIALERGGVEELGEAMLALERRRFAHCEFADRCDPSMLAGEDEDVNDQSEQRVSKGSDRQRLSKKLGRRVLPAVSNVPTRRWDAVRVKIMLNLGPNRPGLLVDPSCKGLIRGFLQTYHFRKIRGTNDLSSVQATFDTHVHDALQYAALECGTEAARKRTTDARLAREQRQKEARTAGRYNAFSRIRR